jgi:hypothetical protein
MATQVTNKKRSTTIYTGIMADPRYAALFLIWLGSYVLIMEKDI